MNGCVLNGDYALVCERDGRKSLFGVQSSIWLGLRRVKIYIGATVFAMSWSVSRRAPLTLFAIADRRAGLKTPLLLRKKREGGGE